MKKSYLYVGLFIAIVLIVIILSSQGNISSTKTDRGSSSSGGDAYKISGVAENKKTDSFQNPSPSPPAESVKEFNMVAKKWEFEPSEIRVKKGDKVRLNIKSIDVTHGIGLPEFGVNSNLVPGKTTTVEFTADKSGTFTFFCSVYCGSGHGQMRGRLIVE